jgi:Family of unknown function (DUF6152)
MKTIFALAVAVLLLIPISVAAHHAFAAEFDRAKPVKVQGTVVKVEWTNPHIWVYVDTKDEKGSVVRWQCEGGSPNTLTRQGWTKDSLKQGDQVTIDGYRAKDGSNTCNSSAVMLADGKRLFAGSSPEGR